jgi:hypothetical protein
VVDVRQRAPCELVLVDPRGVDDHGLVRGPDADRWPAQPLRRLGPCIRGCFAHAVPACARSRRAASSLRRIRRVGEPPRRQCGGRRWRCSAPRDASDEDHAHRGESRVRRPIQSSADCTVPGSDPVPRSVIEAAVRPERPLDAACDAPCHTPKADTDLRHPVHDDTASLTAEPCSAPGPRR